jgi:hypothetical protein
MGENSTELPAVECVESGRSEHDRGLRATDAEGARLLAIDDQRAQARLVTTYQLREVNLATGLSAHRRNLRERCTRTPQNERGADRNAQPCDDRPARRGVLGTQPQDARAKNVADPAPQCRSGDRERKTGQGQRGQD